MSSNDGRPEKRDSIQYLNKAVLALGLAVFLALTLYQIHLPGLHYDEAKEAGLPALQILRGLPVDAFRGAGIRFGEQLVPLMVVDYIGATNVVLALPFLAIGGVDVVALRLLPVVLSALTLLLVYWLARELYNTRVALIAFLLLAVNPSFIFWSRQGIFVTSTIIPISMGAALCLTGWYRRKSRPCLWLGMFLLGLGLYTKFIFLWFIAALAVVFVLFEGKRLVIAVRQGRMASLPYPLGRAEIAGSILAFSAGILPLILYNLQTGGTFGVIGKNLTTSYYGTNNLAFLQNLETRLGQVQSVLSGSHFWYLGGIFENPLWPYAALAALLVTVVTVALVARDEIRRAALPWTIWGVILLASCFTVSALWPTHYAILIPWPPLALAVSVDLVWRHSRTRRWIGWLALLVVALVGVLDVRVDIAYHQALAQSGGMGGHTSAIYDLSDALDAQGLTAPVAMDWGYAAQVEFLTEGHIHPIEIFGYEWNADEGFDQRLRSFIDNPDSVYIFHTPAATVFPRKDEFNALLSEEGKVSTTEAVFNQRDGKAVFSLVRVKDRAEQ